MLSDISKEEDPTSGPRERLQVTLWSCCDKRPNHRFGEMYLQLNQYWIMFFLHRKDPPSYKRLCINPSKYIDLSVTSTLSPANHCIEWCVLMLNPLFGRLGSCTASSLRWWTLWSRVWLKISSRRYRSRAFPGPPCCLGNKSLGSPGPLLILYDVPNVSVKEPFWSMLGAKVAEISWGTWDD